MLGTSTSPPLYSTKNCVLLQAWSISLTGCSWDEISVQSKDDEAIEVHTNLTRMDPDLCESKRERFSQTQVSRVVRDLLLLSKRWKMRSRAQDMADEVLSDLLLLDPDLCESVMEEGMKHWVAYSCWTQISASPWWRRCTLRCEGWTTRERVLESARRDEPGRFSD